ncbi:MULTISPECIES: hypothetical protein [Burkholderia cepacia complex]|jgi:hypothetical protein|uniref:hypothetical protein n=1 Tax=Burkholderia cepacia complex TaxID=87882 RepID=UPI000CF077F8|nr:hypothetical protein [Burkholderia cepacia]KAB1587891.1 hypothetical protein C5O75_028850 [Burkholderia cepacia]
MQREAADIYALMISEAANRLAAATTFLESFKNGSGVAYLESCALQLRKGLETLAFAAIAPNQSVYAAHRAKVEKNPDFTKDYHAKYIFNDLSKINEDFYPFPILPGKNIAPEGSPNNHFHFERKESGYLSKAEFISVYDRLGKHLHARNPWSTGDALAGLPEMAAKTIEAAHGLIELHVAFIRRPDFSGVWVVEIPRGSLVPKMILAQTDGPYKVLNRKS